MKQWFYELLLKLAAWFQPPAAPEPFPHARPQLYVQGLWDVDSKLPVAMTVGDLVNDIAWDESAAGSGLNISQFLSTKE